MTQPNGPQRSRTHYPLPLLMALPDAPRTRRMRGRLTGST